MNDRRPVPPGTRVPHPAHPDQRKQPLPGHRPKPSQEDPDAPDRVRAILASPGYGLAEQDQDFFARDEVRGLRLQIEYLKAELLLQEHGIRDTVVVYGSTRIPEPAVAARRVESLRAALEANPEDRNVGRKLAAQAASPAAGEGSGGFPRRLRHIR